MSEANISAVTSTEVADAFQSAAITVLQELTQIEAFPEQTSSPVKGMSSGGVVLAAIRLLRHTPGTMTLVLSTDTASQLAAHYLPEGTQLIHEIIDDVAGEFANVIAGQAKTILKGTPYHFTMSTPVVTRPENLASTQFFANAGLALALTTELGHVLLRIDLPPCPNA
jgi:CheY-specific phosphatase CheX